MKCLHTLFENKLKMMRSAAPQAELHICPGCGMWHMYGAQALTAKRLSPAAVTLKTFEGDDLLDDDAHQADIPLEKLPQFFAAVRKHHSIALVDVAPGDRTHLARYILVVLLPRERGQQTAPVDDLPPPPTRKKVISFDDL